MTTAVPVFEPPDPLPELVLVVTPPPVVVAAHRRPSYPTWWSSWAAAERCRGREPSAA